MAATCYSPALEMDTSGISSSSMRMKPAGGRDGGDSLLHGAWTSPFAMRPTEGGCSVGDNITISAWPTQPLQLGQPNHSGLANNSTASSIQRPDLLPALRKPPSSQCLVHPAPFIMRDVQHRDVLQTQPQPLSPTSREAPPRL